MTEAIMGPNGRAAGFLAVELRAAGVADACVSPGSRSTPLALAFDRHGIRTWVVLDERSAGYFALGLARTTGRPVALVSTSGTAAANYLPAVVEAALACVPLLVLTADRPPELRDCRAAQTIDQVRLFGSHVRWSVDVPAPSADPDLEAFYRTLACRAVGAALEPPSGPVHLNVPLREPLLDGADLATKRPAPPPRAVDTPWARIHPAAGEPAPGTVAALAESLGRVERGLLVCGPGSGEDAAAPVTVLARALGWPILADPLSGLRFGQHDRSRIVDAYDLLLRDDGFAADHAPEALIQIGAPPVSKPLERFLRAAPRPRHVVVAPAREWPDPSHRATDVVRAAPAAFAAALAGRLATRRESSPWLGSWLGRARDAREALDRAVAAEESLFEGKALPVLVALLPAGALLHVGNSLPVRHLDLFVGGRAAPLGVHGNRGASGIDGVLSTAAGAAAAAPGRPVALVVGDLSFLHDLGGLQAAARHRLDLLVVLLNNDGGGIFSFLPQAELDPERFERLFGTPHGLDVGGAAALCGARLARPRSWDEFRRDAAEALRGGLHVIEIRTDRSELRERHAALVAAGLASLRALGGSP